MREDPYRRHRHTYSFRAWIEEQGSNVDQGHKKRCDRTDPWYIGHCRCLRLWDLNRNGSSLNIIRVVRRFHPLYFHVMVGRKYRTVLRLGRKLDV